MKQMATQRGEVTIDYAEGSGPSPITREQLIAALKPFAKFGKRLLDGRNHVPPSGAWYGLDMGCPTEASLDVEHFLAAIKVIDGKPFKKPSKEKTIAEMKQKKR